MADVHIRSTRPDNTDTRGDVPDMIVDLLLGLIMNTMVTTNTAGQNILKGVMTYNKIEQMKKNDSWKGSLHEEAHQILKDAIKEAGK